MSRPTKQEVERRRIAALAAEGKDPNGDPIEEAEIISETKNTKSDSNTSSKSSYVSDLQEHIDNVTLGNMKPDEPTPSSRVDIDSDKINGSIPPPINPLSEPMIENESDANAGNQKSAPPKTDFVAPEINAVDDSSEQEPKNGTGTGTSNNSTPKGPEPLNSDYENLSASEKESQTRLFAEAIVEAYAEYVPRIFTMICTIDMNKMQIHDKEGKLRLSMVIVSNEEGTKKTVREVFSDFNDKVHSTFKITGEMKKAVLEALIPVLSRRGIAPSPEWTLAIVVGSQILGMTISAFALVNEKNKGYINPMMQLKKEEDEKERNDHINRQEKNSTPPKKEAIVEENEQTINYDDVINTNTPDEEITVETEKTSSPNDITMEDIINADL